MGRKHKNERRRKKRESPGESPAAEVVTVAWGLSVMMVFLCDLGASLTRMYVAANPEAKMIGTLAGLLLFAGAVIGALCLGLLPIVLRARRELPPRGLVVFSIVVSAAPVLFALMQIMR